jgi:lysophospholipase L1-like esterase
MRQRARSLLLFTFVLGVWFVVFEAGLRRWGSSEAAPAFQGLFTGDPVIGYRLQPGARTRFTTSEFDTEIVINRAGVRDDEELGPKDRDSVRILVLGDSLVLSVQVPFAQTFTEQLERHLNGGRSPDRGVSVRVVNAGVQGYGPVEELLLFRRIVTDVQPDLVLVTVFVGNDAEEALTSQVKLSNDRPYVEALRESIANRLRRTVRRSMVLQVLRLRVVAATSRFRSTPVAPEPPLPSYARNPVPRITRGIELTRDALAQLAEEARRAGARTGILLMPARFQVDDGDYGRLREIVARAGGELQRDAASERFAAALGELGLPMLDLLPALRQAPTGPDLFFQENVHLTLRGHAVVAEALARFVREQRLLAH